MGRVTERRRVVRLRDGRRDARPDALAAEEPLEIRVGGRSLAITMRTPGDDFDLVAGYLVAEGVVASGEDLPTLRYCAGTNAEGENTYNVVDARVADPAAVPVSAYRQLLTTSACGLCGAETVDAVQKRLRYDLATDDLKLTSDLLYSFPDALRTGQRAFATTGGVHAAGLFTAEGRLLCVREDVGRHNAVDKVIGWALREGLLPLHRHALMVSGRASFELVQKAAMAGIPLLAAVSAPSALAVDLATETGMTLVGFLRDRSANIYAGADRIA
ncbi:FdhD protein [Streptacidiphilus sp. BW17]|jgi:FdhD protein|uniref:formate dehydrogenase accessory sulfurtransferase FdhD n=1 Tax=Streptacidiphilus sp. BW17 TaxID=3156274 RepID=UPI003510EE14